MADAECEPSGSVREESGNSAARRDAGGGVSIPGFYVTEDPGAADESAKLGNLSVRIGLGWAKSLHFYTGQCPAIRYNRQLMQAILYGKAQIAKALNVTVISLEKAPPKKFVLDPHGDLGAAA